MLVRVLLFSSAFILFVCAFGAERRSADGESKSFDPWSPDRNFCGRLTIHLAGAGEITPFTINGKKDETRNVYGEFTVADFREFYGDERSPMWSISLLMSGDLNVQNTVKKIATKETKLIGGAGFWSSEDAFQEFVSNDLNASLLEKALAYFASTDTCRRLMGNDESVLSYLKTEIIIETEHAPGGIPIWATKGETGSVAEYYQQSNPKIIDSQLLSKLRSRLKQSVVQTFVNTCQGRDMAEALQDNSSADVMSRSLTMKIHSSQIRLKALPRLRVRRATQKQEVPTLSQGH